MHNDRVTLDELNLEAKLSGIPFMILLKGK